VRRRLDCINERMLDACAAVISPQKTAPMDATTRAAASPFHPVSFTLYALEISSLETFGGHCCGAYWALLKRSGGDLAASPDVNPPCPARRAFGSGFFVASLLSPDRCGTPY
jgi:hypothetical protein